MFKEVSVYKEDFFIERFSEDDPIKITKAQYEGLEKVLLDSQMKFVKIGDQIINTNSIKRVIKVAHKPNSDIFAETGSNPYYREWCMGKNKVKFKEWIQKKLDKSQ